MRIPKARHDSHAIEQKMCITTLRALKGGNSERHMQIHAYVPMLMNALVLKDASPCFSGEPSNPERSANYKTK